METHELVEKLRSLLAEKAKTQVKEEVPNRDPPSQEEPKTLQDPAPRPAGIEGLGWQELLLMEMDGCFDDRPDILRWFGKRILPGQLMPRLKI